MHVDTVMPLMHFPPKWLQTQLGNVKKKKWLNYIRTRHIRPEPLIWDNALMPKQRKQEMMERSSDARGFSEHSKRSACGPDTRPAPVCFAHRPVKWMPTIVCSLLTPRLENSAPSICSRIRLRRTLTLGAVDRRCEGTTDMLYSFSHRHVGCSV